jgi:hypothetical protein
MKVLASVLAHEGIDRSTLRILFEQDGETTYALTVGGYEAVDLWERLRALAPQTGRWPLLVGSPGEEDLPTGREVWAYEEGGQARLKKAPRFQDILKEAEKIDARALLDGWYTQRIADLEELLAEAVANRYGEDAEHFRSLLNGPKELRGMERGDWPENAEPNSPWSIAAGITHDRDMQERQVTLALLPVERGWEAPAVMKFGGWNECPHPADHVAVLRYWHEQFGADVVAITNDTVEAMVARPPRSKKAALSLARDQYQYCPDIVTQGTYTLDTLAAGLLRGEAWYFWWD